MFVFKKKLSRRTILKGAGATIALPLLDAMIPAGTAFAQTAAAPHPRLGFIYFPHGALQDEWQPKTVGKNPDFPFILQPLEPFREHVTVISGLRTPTSSGNWKVLTGTGRDSSVMLTIHTIAGSSGDREGSSGATCSSATSIPR